jgi:hypothetical protein
LKGFVVVLWLARKISVALYNVYFSRVLVTLFLSNTPIRKSYNFGITNHRLGRIAVPLNARTRRQTVGKME